MSTPRIISTSFFRTKTISDNFCKTYVYVFNDGVVMITKRLLMYYHEYPKGYTSIKQFKNWHLCENTMAFKINSFNTIVEIVNNVKPYFKETEIIL